MKLRSPDITVRLCGIRLIPYYYLYTFIKVKYLFCLGIILFLLNIVNLCLFRIGLKYW